MKKVVNLLLFIYILLLFYLTKDTVMLPLTISFSMYMLYNSLFSSVNIKDVIGTYHDNKKYYLRDKLFLYAILTIFLIGIILAFISYLIGNTLDIDKLNIINIFMSFSLISNILIKVIKEYSEVVGYKKLGNNLINIFYIIVLSISVVLIVLLFNVFKLNNCINFILLYSVNIFVFVVFAVIFYLKIFKRKIKNEDKENIKYIENVKKIVINDKRMVICNVIKSSYIYFSIIILYYILINKYNYSYELVSKSISNTYFYGLIIIYYIFIFIDKYININYDNIKDNFDKNFNKLIKISLNISVLLIIISNPLSNLLIGYDYNILTILVPVLFFYMIYNFIVNINMKYTKDISVLIVLLSGLFIKLIFELPLINTLYRMGYSLIWGSILSSIIGLIVSIIIGIIFIKCKFKLNLLNNFNNILNIIYESIIYTLVLVLFTLIVKIDTDSRIISLLVIVFYIFISILFSKIRIILTKK